ncbi:MAG: hypothetical protein R8F63_17635 [Acidimicrobiales bacterium]|nr:hypothetical protein [Acidimicrobiales bacterium]
MWRERISAEPSAWRGTANGPRVLVEHHDPNVGLAVGDLLASEGYEVATCGGPADRRPCPLSRGDRCGRTAEADVVLFGLEVEDELDRDVLARLKTAMPDTPIVVEIPTARVPLYAAELDGCVTVPRPMTRDALLEAIERSLR